jgi:hypothetical protein
MNTGDEELGDVWDASCWPIRVVVRGDFEYTLVKTGKGECFGPRPTEECWEACPFQHSIPSPLDASKRAEFRLDAKIKNSKIIYARLNDDDPNNDFIQDGVWLYPKPEPRPKECMDCHCLYADLNEYMVYRRRKTQP